MLCLSLMMSYPVGDQEEESGGRGQDTGGVGEETVTQTDGFIQLLLGKGTGSDYLSDNRGFYVTKKLKVEGINH